MNTILICDSENVFAFEQLDNERVRRMLCTLKARTSTGPDGISAAPLKTGSGGLNLTAEMKS